MMKDQPTVAEIAVTLAAAMLGREKGCIAVTDAVLYAERLHEELVKRGHLPDMMTHDASGTPFERFSLPWHEAPEWAQWAAMDGNGSWWWYSNRPQAESNDGDAYWSCMGDRNCRALLFKSSGLPSPDWRDSLASRPE